jgi:hypothetical protein
MPELQKKNSAADEPDGSMTDEPAARARDVYKKSLLALRARMTEFIKLVIFPLDFRRW